MRTVFVDTNVLVYASDSAAGRKHAVAEGLLGGLGMSRLTISAQVLSEYANVLVHPRKRALSAALALTYVRRMARSLHVLPIDVPVVVAALEGVDRWGMAYYDAQIWAVAALNNISIVLSEDFPSGAILGGVRFVNPFEPGFDPASL